MTFENFVTERVYFTNVTPKTVPWYWQAWKSWQKYGAEPLAFVQGLRTSGASAATVNCYAGALNAYFKQAALPTHIPTLKEEQHVLSVFNPSDINRFFLLDTGVRIDEAISLRTANVDFENLLIIVDGKGGKQRRIPISNEMRKALWRFKEKAGHTFFFGQTSWRQMAYRNTYRGIALLCARCGVKPPRRMVHAFRHTFAVNYLRRGGSAFHLQKILGRSSLDMTRRYCNLMTEDLQAVH